MPPISFRTVDKRSDLPGQVHPAPLHSSNKRSHRDTVCEITPPKRVVLAGEEGPFGTEA